jgi:hypothetical protein
LDQNVTQYVLQELLPAFENLDAQSAAILAFLKDKHIATEEALKPYLVQSSMASSVKWRAIRVRLEHLLAPVPKTTTEAAKKESQSPIAEGSEVGKGGETAKPNANAEPESAHPKSGADIERKTGREQNEASPKPSDVKQSQDAKSKAPATQKQPNRTSEKAVEDSKPQESAVRKS